MWEVDVPLDAQHRPARGRPARDQRDRHRALGPARQAARRAALRPARREGAPSLPAYASWLYATEDLDALAAEAARWAAQGFTAVKQRLPYGPARRPERDRRNVELVQTVVGRGRPRRRRDGRRVHELGRRLRDPLHPGDRGRRHPAALDRGARRFPTTSPGSRASARPSRRRSRPASTRPRATASVSSSTAGAVDVLQPDVNRLGGHHGGAAHLGARRDVRAGRDSASRFRAQRAPRDREPRDAAARVHAASRRSPGRGRRGSDLLGRVPGRAARRSTDACHSRDRPGLGVGPRPRRSLRLSAPPRELATRC